MRTRVVLAHRPVQGVPAGYTDFMLFAADFAVLLMLVLWALSLLRSPRRLTFGPRILWISLAGLTLAGCASIMSSYDPQLSAYHAIRLVVLFWFYVYIVNEIRSIRWLLAPLGIQLLVQSVIALAQFGLQHSVGFQSLGELYLEPAQSGVSIVASGGLRLLRAYGLTDHPNILGGCLAFGLVLFLAAYLHGTWRWLAPVVMLPAGAALLVTFSRSAWLAFLMGAVLLFSVELFKRQWETLRRALWLGLAWLLLVAPLILAFPRFFGTRLNLDSSFSSPTVEQQSLGERLLLIQAARSMLADYPWLGVGLGTAPLALKVYRPHWSLGFEPPHFAWLEAAIETGLPGAAFYLALCVAPFMYFFRRRMFALPDPMPATMIALLLAVMAVGFFDYYTWLLLPGRLWQWLAWGLCAAAFAPESALAFAPASLPAHRKGLLAHVSPTD
jgi:O-antigen ligase